MAESNPVQQFGRARDIFDEMVAGPMSMCRIYDKYAGQECEHQNCLGDNFNDITQQISWFLNLVADSGAPIKTSHSFSIYALLLNSVWERVTDILDILTVPAEYRHRHFESFMVARRWANFFKHPKAFAWLVDFPEYVTAGSDKLERLQADGKERKYVDEEFLKTYYSSDCTKNRHKLKGEFLGHEKTTVVILPKIDDLTKDICTALDDFVHVVTDNPVYVEVLTSTSSILDYFDRECETGETI